MREQEGLSQPKLSTPGQCPISRGASKTERYVSSEGMTAPTSVRRSRRMSRTKRAALRITIKGKPLHFKKQDAAAKNKSHVSVSRGWGNRPGVDDGICDARNLASPLCRRGAT
jgi:hypothetical protein